MELKVHLEQKECAVTITPAAEAALNKRSSPLVAEIVVTLACCIRKSVSFRELRAGEQPLLVSPHLAIALVSAEHQSGAASLPPISNWHVLAPQWLALDFRNGTWRGDFGYTTKKG